MKENSIIQEETPPESSIEDEGDEAAVLNRLNAVLKITSTGRTVLRHGFHLLKRGRPLKSKRELTLN